MIGFNFRFNRAPSQRDDGANTEIKNKENLLDFGNDEQAIPEEKEIERIEIDESQYLKPHPASDQSFDKNISKEELGKLWGNSELKDTNLGGVNEK